MTISNTTLRIVTCLSDVKLSIEQLPFARLLELRTDGIEAYSNPTIGHDPVHNLPTCYILDLLEVGLALHALLG